jgi:hypothetical protein
MIEFLHHVKAATPAIVSQVARITHRVIVLEPNGNNPIRKARELAPSYYSAGKDSFRTGQLQRIFEVAGFRTAMWRRMNLFPNFAPGTALSTARPVGGKRRSGWPLKTLYAVNMFGFDTANPKRTPA